MLILMSRKNNTWIQALREFNKNKDNWCIPRKGTKDHNQVKQINDKLSELRKKGIKKQKKSDTELSNIRKNIEKEKIKDKKESEERTARLKKLDAEFQFP